jgi:hypothetical protein
MRQVALLSTMLRRVICGTFPLVIPILYKGWLRMAPSFSSSSTAAGSAK